MQLQTTQTGIMVGSKKLGDMGTYIGRGRGSLFANPFYTRSTTVDFVQIGRERYGVSKCDSVQESVSSYRRFALQRLLDNPVFRRAFLTLAQQSQQELVILVCWCKEKGHEPCHGDVVKELVERYLENPKGFEAWIKEQLAQG